MKQNLLEQLLEEKNMRLKGGIYHLTQIKLAYNSNRIEGSRLSEEQTRYIYETNTVGADNGEAVNVDDIIETVNHFACFDYMLEHAGEDLSEDLIKEFHKFLKRGTSDERKGWFRVGEYKARANTVGEKRTTPPEEVAEEMEKLLERYNRVEQVRIEDIVDFHYKFESIHPFQDGNGRVGRVIMFKECLKNNLMPFIINNEHKMFYYRGLKEYEREKGYLWDTCLAAQDRYGAEAEYFLMETE